MSLFNNFLKKINIFSTPVKEEEKELIEYDYSEYYYKDLNECIRWHGKPILIEKKNNMDIKSDFIFDDYDIRYEFKYLIVYIKNNKITKIYPK